MCDAIPVFPVQLADVPCRVRYQVTSVGALNFVAESAKLAELIRQYNI